MGDELQQDFLNETINNLGDFQKELRAQSSQILAEDLLRRLFRCIHTIKGTAQTFSLSNLSHPAHEIENLLQVINTAKIQQNEETLSIIVESLELLLTSCQDKNSIISKDFFERLNKLIPPENKENSVSLLDGKVPKSLLSKLSSKEIEALNAAFKRDKLFYLLEAAFEISVFNEGFINFRRVLGESGEIIAISPSEKFDAAKEIGLNFFYATDQREAKVREIIAPFAARIDFASHKDQTSAADLAGLLSNLIADCKKKARFLDKKVLFEVSNEVQTTTRQNLILINHSLLHLLRNAIDHAIELPAERLAANKTPHGKIKVDIFEKDNHLILRLADDGRGIDTNKINQQAQKRGIITTDQSLTDDEILKLIFAHGFSTNEIVSEISGRGVGLDIVNDLIKKAGGKIDVHTETNRGTTFEIRLPA